MRSLDIETMERAAEKRRVDIGVFLAGPFIDTTKAAEIAKPNYSEAALLRLDLFNRMKRFDWINTTLGEHKQLQELYSSHFESFNNAALTEMAHAHEKCDCIIIIPSSPGSFSELGMFSVNEDICDKMLILLDKNHESPPGYVHLGPVRNAINFGAYSKFVDYQDLNSVWTEFFRYINRIRTRKLSRRFMVARR